MAEQNQTQNRFNDDSSYKTSFSQKSTNTQNKCQALEFGYIAWSAFRTTSNIEI